jgi:crotonobetainyl-CoA:carnitine CoA-transferase CaiB-like acyl-CoA transferase
MGDPATGATGDTGATGANGNTGAMGAMAGIRVVDVTSGVAGPMATMALSDHGADVIKVEPPGGDPMRSTDAYTVWNRGKRSVVLDLHRQADRTKFRQLLATADVLIEGFSPGTMAGWGLGYDAVHAEFPHLVYCSVTGYGRTTAAADRPGYDLLVQARSGEQYEQPGWRDGPIYLYLPLPSLATSFLTLNGVLAALHARNVTGVGQWVETSLYQGVLAFTTQLWQKVEDEGDYFWGIPMHSQMGLFECSDEQWVHSMHNSGGRGKDRSKLWEILNIEPQIFDMDPAIMAANEDKVRAAVRKIPRDKLLKAFWDNDFAIAPVRQTFEAFDDEQVVHTGLIVDVDDPVVGHTRQVGPTFRMHGAPSAGVQGPQPTIGQHTAEVLASVDAATAVTANASVMSTAHTAGRDAGRTLKHPLEGITVVDFGNFLAGPFGPMLLGDLGATVIKVESTGGDQMRNVTKPFNGCQRGKLDVAVDLKTPQGLEIARKLIATADVVHHNMRPGVAERLGIGYEQAKALNPKIIYAHTTMWGTDGPRRNWPGFDQLGQSSTGCEYEIGGEGNPPVWYRFGMCDQACACLSAVAVLMAIYWRDLTGEGQLVDSSILTGGMYFNSDVWFGPNGPTKRPRLDQQQTGISPLYRLYRTLDGWIAIVVISDAHWQSLTAVFPALGTDARFADGVGRTRHAAELASYLETQFAGGTAAEWFARLDSAAVPVEIADPTANDTWYDEPSLVAAGLVADYPHPQYGRFRQFGHLIHFSDTPGRIAGPPPLLGEHSRQVLAQLGYSDSEMNALREAGATTWP